MAEQRRKRQAEHRKPRSFIVRLWLEPEGRWRGHIQSVQSGESAYFQDLQEMLRFLEEQSGVPFPLTAGATAKNPEQPQGG
jgi:hypothetical protein